MIKTILVPLDGSAVAEQGLVAACRIARETGAALLLLRSVVYFAVEEATREEARTPRSPSCTGCPRHSRWRDARHKAHQLEGEAYLRALGAARLAGGIGPDDTRSAGALRAGCQRARDGGRLAPHVGVAPHRTPSNMTYGLRNRAGWP